MMEAIKRVSTSDFEDATVNQDYELISRMLDHLSRGDADVRLDSESGGDLVRRFGPGLNAVADFMQTIINESHEAVIGLCEHYETLRRLTGGDLSARASVSSSNEVIAKLGELINSQAATFREVIAQQREQTEELHALNDRLQGIIEFLPDATFVIDAEHRVIAWNRALEEMTGVSAKEVAGKGDYEYAIPFYGIRRPALIDFIGSDMDASQYNYRNFEKKGESIIAEGVLPGNPYRGEMYAWMTASPLFSSQGERIGAIESVRDITPYRKAELEKELLRDQLHHSQKLESIGQLSGGVAHEFNNILAAIMGYANIIEMRLEPDSPLRTYLHRILNSSQKAAQLTQSMLAFSRKQYLSMGPVDLNQIVESMEELLVRLSGEDIRIHFSLDRQSPLMINADQGQIQQVILNLYNNARDAMPDGGLLTISTERIETGQVQKPLSKEIDADSYCLLTISDTGSGIPPENRAKIFDPFFTTKGVGKGTGLGLSMVYGIVQQHDGAITLSSEPGSGSSFHLWFPEIEYKQDEATTSPEAIKGPLQQNGGETILVADDSEDVRSVIASILGERGYRVLEAHNGTEVLQIMEKCGTEVDLLLLDVMMPQMNGYDAMRQVRVSYPLIPCVFLSGYSDAEVRRKVADEELFDTLAKPFEPEALLATVRAKLDAHAVAP